MNPSRSAFTLIELLVVIVIIAVLAGLVVGISGLATKKADRGKAVADMEQLKNALEEYRLDYGAYPAQDGALDGTGAAMKQQVAVLMGYNTNLVVTDPWGRGYNYERKSKYLYRLWSEGPDSLTDVDDIEVAAGKL